MKKSKFDFGFAADEDEESSSPEKGESMGLPDTVNIPSNLRQTPASLRPAQYPNTESFAVTNASIVSGSDNVGIEPPTPKTLDELNQIEVKTGADDGEDVEIYRSEAQDVDYDLKNQQNMFYSQQNNVSKMSTQAVLIDKDILTDPNNF